MCALFHKVHQYPYMLKLCFLSDCELHCCIGPSFLAIRGGKMVGSVSTTLFQKRLHIHGRSPKAQ